MQDRLQRLKHKEQTRLDFLISRKSMLIEALCKIIAEQKKTEGFLNSLGD